MRAPAAMKRRAVSVPLGSSRSIHSKRFTFAVDRAKAMLSNICKVYVALALVGLGMGLDLPAQTSSSSSGSPRDSLLIEPYHEGGCALLRPSSREPLCSGDTIVASVYYSDGQPKRHLYYVQQRGLWGVIDASGHWDVPCVSDQRPFFISANIGNGGFWLVFRGRKRGAYRFGADPDDVRGDGAVTPLVPIEMDKVRLYWMVDKRYMLDVWKDGLQGLYSQSGKEIFPPKYKRIETLDNPMALQYTDEILLDDGERILVYPISEVMDTPPVERGANVYRQVDRLDHIILYITASGDLHVRSFKERHTFGRVDSASLHPQGAILISQSGRQRVVLVQGKSVRSLIPAQYDELRFVDSPLPRLYARRGKYWGVLYLFSHEVAVPLESEVPPEPQDDPKKYRVVRGGKELYYDEEQQLYIDGR